MEVRYLHLVPGHQPPSIEAAPFKAVIVVRHAVDAEWQRLVSEWLIDVGCLYMMAWGPYSSTWDDSVDRANRDASTFEDMPDDMVVMTTWHNEEPLSETLWFAGKVAHHPTVELTRMFIIEVGVASTENEMLAAYDDAQQKY